MSENDQYLHLHPTHNHRHHRLCNYLAQPDHLTRCGWHHYTVWPTQCGLSRIPAIPSASTMFHSIRLDFDQLSGTIVEAEEIARW